MRNLKRDLPYLPSILAGAVISISCLVYLSCGNRYVGSILFSLGVLNVMFFKLPLFTGVAGNAGVRVIDLISIWLDNFIGVLIVVALINNTRLSPLQEQALIMVQQKENDTYISLFILSIFCGMLMFMATQTARADNNIVDKTIRTIFCIAVFVLIGFEHCVADMFYFAFAQATLSDLARLIIISIGNGIGANIIPIVERSVSKC